MIAVTIGAESLPDDAIVRRSFFCARFNKLFIKFMSRDLSLMSASGEQSEQFSTKTRLRAGVVLYHDRVNDCIWCSSNGRNGVKTRVQPRSANPPIYLLVSTHTRRARDRQVGRNATQAGVPTRSTNDTSLSPVSRRLSRPVIYTLLMQSISSLSHSRRKQELRATERQNAK